MHAANARWLELCWTTKTALAWRTTDSFRWLYTVAYWRRGSRRWESRLRWHRRTAVIGHAARLWRDSDTQTSAPTHTHTHTTVLDNDKQTQLRTHRLLTTTTVSALFVWNTQLSCTRCCQSPQIQSHHSQHTVSPLDKNNRAHWIQAPFTDQQRSDNKPTFLCA